MQPYKSDPKRTIEFIFRIVNISNSLFILIIVNKHVFITSMSSLFLPYIITV